MNNLITVNFDTQMVSARELHESLKIKSNFTTWFKRMCEYGFTEGIDFNPLTNEQVQKEGIDFFPKMEKTSETGGRPQTDYNISVDMAKQICMIQRTPEGKAIRQYLIDLEKSWNTPEQVMARALRMADATINELKEHNTKLLEDNQMMKPKADYCDNVLNKNSLLTTTDIAKDLGMTARKLNSLLVQNKILYKKNGCYYTYASYDWLVEDGYADYKIYEDNYHQMLKWTEKGRKWIVENLNNWE